MISKNVKRFVSGLLLSCNVMSFSGYAVDVLKEGNCGSSEGLKILYCTGRVFQESLAQNSVSATENIRKKMIDTFYNKLRTVKCKLTCIKRLKDFWNKFKAYLDISELSKVKNEFIELLKSDEHLVEYCMILDPIFTFPKEEKEIAEKAIISYIRAKLFSDNKYQFIVYSYLLDIMSKTNLKNISIKNISIKSYIEGYLFKNDLYKDEFIEWFEENQKVIFAPEKLIEEFSKMYNALYENINYILIDYVEFTKKSLSANIKDEKKLENTKEKVKKSAIKKIEDIANNKIFDVSSKETSWKELCLNNLQTFLNHINECLDNEEKSLVAQKEKYSNWIRQIEEYSLWRPDKKSVSLNIDTAFSEYDKITIAKSIENTSFKLPMLNINKSNLSVSNVLIYYQSITLSNINSINEQLPSKLLFLTKKIVVPAICNNPDNFHLEEHFKENGYIVSKLNKTEKLIYGGKFNVSGSMFEKANNVLDLLDTPMDNKIIIVATYDVKKDGKNFKNHVFYIYDYKNYGFVKTGDVYSKLDNKWHPAYALMFVTDENNDLVTVHPRYM